MKGTMKMPSPLANIDSLRIGSVDFVSPDEIKVLLDIEAPNDIALNAGTPRPFPRVNSYVLVQSENGYLVAQIQWITIERSQYPKRQGIKDFGIIDLPYPLRKMSLSPLGMLKENTSENKESRYKFIRGIDIFPTVGDPVLLPTQVQLKSIIESGDNRRVAIGLSPLAGNAIVSVDPDRLFGRHLAVLGNTGSGKSCSVAGLIRWSIEAARKEKRAAFKQHALEANSRFIILDPNGEYTSAFKDISTVRVFGVIEDRNSHIGQLHLPLWLLNSKEWVALTQASSKVQKPTLIQALRMLRYSKGENVCDSVEMCNYLNVMIQTLKGEIKNGSPLKKGPAKGLREFVQSWEKDIVCSDNFTDLENVSIRNLKGAILTFLSSSTTPDVNWPLFTIENTKALLLAFQNTFSSFGGCVDALLPMNADIPRVFSEEAFLHILENQALLMGNSEYIETMLVRVRALFSDLKLKQVISSENITFVQWLNDYLCPSNQSNGSITIIDLSMAPAEIIHIITAVIARLTLEALQRYRKLNNGKTLPLTLVMEEAHNFIKRYNSDAEVENASDMCTKVFEKIAREGRKFGLGLVLSSQRPSELSPTVLSQCNSFLLHRINNDKDQELVGKLIPDNLRALLRELPSLPSRNAILLGWASELPVVVEMKYLKEDMRPQSNDPDFWNVWTSDERQVDWKTVADDWQEIENRTSDDGSKGDSIE